MTEAVFNRIVAIVENGTYNDIGLSTGGTTTKAARTLLDTFSIGNRHVLILPRGDTGEVKESGSGFYTTTLNYVLNFYIKEAKEGNDTLGIADATNYIDIAKRVFLSRPRLELAGQNPVQCEGVYKDISLQITSSLYTPILYPPSGVSVQQGAIPYWGFVMALAVPYRRFIKHNVGG